MSQDFPVDVVAATRSSARAHILECAKRLFAARGFNGTSISDIAKASGVSKANIFHHFESKEGLYLATIASIVERAKDVSSPSDAEGRDVVAFFQELAVAEQRRAAEDPEGVLLTLREILSGDPQRSRVLAKEIFAENFNRLVDLIRHEQENGRLRADVDPALAATLLRSANVFYWMGREVLRHMPGVNFAEDGDAYARRTTELLLRGLLPDRGAED